METLKTYRGRDIEITFDTARCLHAAECVRGLPAVFDVDRRPWVDPDGAPADRAAEVVRRCPSGALQYRMTNGAETAPGAGGNRVVVGKDGPLYLRGAIVLRRADVPPRREPRVALCRCGASENKPYCDGRHSKVGFHDAGAAPPAESGAGTEADLIVTASPNGPLVLEGPYRLEPGGEEEATRGALCRCGKSQRKPHCDGSHRTARFRA